MDKNYESFKERMDALVEAKNYRAIRPLAEEMQEADIAEYLSGLDISKALPVFRTLPKELAADVFSYFEPDVQENFITSVTDEEIRRIIEELSVDDAVYMLEELPATVVKRVLKNAANDTRSELNRFLNYSDDSVGSIMTSEFTDLKSSMTVGEAIEYIRRVGSEKETIYTCFVISPSRVLEGVIELCDILKCRDDSVKIDELMDVNVIKVTTSENKEEAAKLFSKYDLVSLPVVDSENRLVGIVTVDDIVDVIEEEATKDMEQMAAMQHIETPYLKTGIMTIVKARLPWLFILMIAGMINGAILGKFEAAIAAIPLLVTFMPMLTDTGGNSGSQATTTVIRGLTTGDLKPHDVFKILWKEIRVAVIVGTIFAAVNFLRIVLFTNDPDRILIGFTVAVAMVFTILLAKSLGAVLPVLVQKLHLDPAVVAAPMITTVVDAVSLTVYFRLAMTLLSSRL